MSDNHAFGRPIQEDGRGIVETMRTESAAISNNFNAVNSGKSLKAEKLTKISYYFS